jgi:hypothetical protein
MLFAAEAVTLTAEERAELEQMTQSRTLPYGDVFRVRLILRLADGLPYRTIQERLDTTAPTISRWKNRFLKESYRDSLAVLRSRFTHPQNYRRRNAGHNISRIRRFMWAMPARTSGVDPEYSRSVCLSAIVAS